MQMSMCLCLVSKILSSRLSMSNIATFLNPVVVGCALPPDALCSSIGTNNRRNAGASQPFKAPVSLAFSSSQDGVFEFEPPCYVEDQAAYGGCGWVLP